MSSDTRQFIPLKTDTIRTKIFLVRGQQVMLDKDIAALYEVKPIRLREQVQRNIECFPEDFMVSQNAITSRKHLGGSLGEMKGKIKSAKSLASHNLDFSIHHLIGTINRYLEVGYCG